MSAGTMKALRFAAFGPPSVLRIEEVAIPEPGEGEALIQVKAAAINPSDIANVAGRFKKTTLPRTPGRDFAGVVIKGMQHEGEEVWGSAPILGIERDGSHAEYVVVPLQTISPKPKVVEPGASGGNRSSVHHGLVCRGERRSDSTWRNDSHHRRRRSHRASGHADCKLETSARYRSGHQVRPDSRG